LDVGTKKEFFVKIALVIQSLLLVTLVVIVSAIRPAPLDIGIERMNAIITSERGKGRAILADDMAGAINKTRQEQREQVAPLDFTGWSLVCATRGVSAKKPLKR
jgi:hypothetical protein